MLNEQGNLHLSGLSGLRAIAALSVVIAHVSLKGIADFGTPYLPEFQMAGFGVTLFFVISGFLITFLLLLEIDKKKNIDIRKFYIRRILRIWPIYYLFIIVSIVIFFLIRKPEQIVKKEMWYYVFFLANVPFVFQQGVVILIHYWSIGVEEQFYLIWPWLVRLSRKRILETAFSIFVVLFFTKLIIWFFLGPSSYAYRVFTISRFDCMMIGAMGAILYFNSNSFFIRLFSDRLVQFISWILFLLMSFNIVYIPSVIAHEIVAITSVSMIMGQIIIKRRIINLENKPCDFIGKISYGIYIIHPLVIFNDYPQSDLLKKEQVKFTDI